MTSCKKLSGPRRGRALVESLVSLVLVAGGALALITSVRASALLGVDARRGNESQRVHGAIVESMVLAACDSAAAAPAAPLWMSPALAIDIAQTTQPELRRVHARVRWHVSPFAAGTGTMAEHARVVSSAVACR